MHDLNMKDIKVNVNDSIFILHLNISSLHKHSDELYELCVSLRYKPDILCITETRLVDVPLINISIPGYNFFHCNSPTIVGGVGVYFKQNIKVERTHKFIFNMNGVEEIWFEFAGTNSLEKHKRIFVCFYRHPSQKNSQEFLTNLNNCLANLNLANKQYYIVGDMNINTLCNNYQESLAKKYDLILKSNGCFQTITTATRITTCSKTLLDHIITNESELQITPKVFIYQISDHSLTFVMLKNTQCSSQKCKYRETLENQKFRCFSNYETAKFVEDLKLELENNFNQIPEITPANFNEEFNTFNKVILKVVNKHAPLKFASRKQKRLLQKPWITKDIFDAIRRKQKMYKTHFKSEDPHKIAKYKKYANKVNHL